MIALIPARGGSKRIPRKNIKLFAGRPMIGWAIETATKCGCFERVVVSTDSEEIALVSRSLGAEVPFIRPAHLADDHADTASVVQHSLDELQVQDELLCCIYATTPMLLSDDIVAGIEAVQKDPAVQYAFTVGEFSCPIERALRLTGKGGVEPIYPENMTKRTQDLSHAFFDAGQFYVGRVSAWKRRLPIFGPYSTPIRLPAHRAIDIDNEQDWRRAELLFELVRGANKSIRE